MSEAPKKRLKGYATPEGTKQYFTKHPLLVPPAKLGRTGLHVSPVGFGGYRIDQDHPEHRQALIQALRSGCNLIDTSTNYMDGESEFLIGDVLTELVANETVSRDEVVVVTKVGYVQGSNLSLARSRIEEKRPFPEMTEYSDDCWHCIHPQFLEDQITRSLERLNVECIDVLLLHNPEYYLSDKNASHGAYYVRLRAAFTHLETEVSRGRIRWFGISSNTFVSDRESPEFTSLEICIEEAEKVDPNGHFAVVQFPMNLFEPGAAFLNSNTGRTVLEVAALNRIGTLVNRPLNAYISNRLVRLADFPNGGSPEDAIERLKAAFEKMLDFELKFPPEIEGASKELAWGHMLHRGFANIQSLDRWRGVLEYQIRPALDEILPVLARDTHRNAWLATYRELSEELFGSITHTLESQAAELSNHLFKILDENCPHLATSKSLSRKSIRIYRSLPGVHCILVGMRLPEYVQDILTLEPVTTPEEAITALETIQNDLEESLGSGT